MRASIAESKRSDNDLALMPVQSSQRDLQARLQTTFSAFNDISHRLTSSYLELEQRVDELQFELAEVDSARIKGICEREALSERVQLIVNMMPVAVILLDGRGVVMQANTIAETLFERRLPGLPWIKVINECLSPKPADGHEIALKNGKLVSLATQSMTHEPGQIIVLNDQTETRRLQNKLNHHRKLCEMGRMTASLAHQIRTPLSTAILYADHLGAEQLSEERRMRYSRKLKERLMQLEQQVRDMLIFSQGGLVLDSLLPVFQLVSVLQSRVEDYRQTSNAVIEFDQDIPSGSVRCNPDLLSSVFANVIDNAIEACDVANIVPYIQVNTSLCSGGLIEFHISDNGPGLPSGQCDRVVEPFYTTKSTGTGLGLSVVKAVIEAHGGYFTIANSYDVGAVACLALPLEQGNRIDSEEV